MQKPRNQTFIVTEGSVVMGSFVTLKDAVVFRARSGSRTTRIVADHGEFDKGCRNQGQVDVVSVRDATPN